MLPDRQASQTFHIIPSTTKTFVFIAIVLGFCMVPVVATSVLAQVPIVVIAWIVTLGTGAVITYIGWSSRHVRFEMSAGGLRVHNSLFGRTIPRADLVPEQARAVSIPEQPELKPILRTFGSGLIGYCEGWFRLRNWQKALIFLTDRTRVVDLPTRQGYRILLSVPSPEHFLQAAHHFWGVPAPAGEAARGSVPVDRGALEPR